MQREQLQSFKAGIKELERNVSELTRTATGEVSDRATEHSMLRLRQRGLQGHRFCLVRPARSQWLSRLSLRCRPILYIAAHSLRALLQQGRGQGPLTAGEGRVSVVHVSHTWYRRSWKRAAPRTPRTGHLARSDLPVRYALPPASHVRPARTAPCRSCEDVCKAASIVSARRPRSSQSRLRELESEHSATVGVLTAQLERARKERSGLALGLAAIAMHAVSWVARGAGAGVQEVVSVAARAQGRVSGGVGATLQAPRCAAALCGGPSCGVL
jgi:hypothetical protein